MRSAVLASTTGSWVVVQDGVVVERGDRDPPSRAEVIGDVVLSPGFVDLQVNGIGAAVEECIVVPCPLGWMTAIQRNKTNDIIHPFFFAGFRPRTGIIHHLFLIAGICYLFDLYITEDEDRIDGIRPFRQ